MTEGVRIRPARRDEGPTLSALAMRSKAHWGYDAAFMAACRAELTITAARTERSAIAELDGALAGFVTLDGGPPEGEIGMMFVAPEAMGRGIGRLLFTHAADTARAAGCTSLLIDADPHAEGFYRAMGGVRIGEMPSESIAGRMLPLLRLDLHP
ncbi:GNAT family N-acetyltransferase [Streptomyces avicenniae]|uniref:GNAT family N-acetyltransferase n=1 Tax=Streptomyces avicenniae TaxID=500153 RepID=UPI0006999669|nr:GNAT family N-acetyltransferase [Streptomyces avicenniae]